MSTDKDNTSSLALYTGVGELAEFDPLEYKKLQEEALSSLLDDGGSSLKIPIWRLVKDVGYVLKLGLLTKGLPVDEKKELYLVVLGVLTWRQHWPITKKSQDGEGDGPRNVPMCHALPVQYQDRARLEGVWRADRDACPSYYEEDPQGRLVRSCATCPDSRFGTKKKYDTSYTGEAPACGQVFGLLVAHVAEVEGKKKDPILGKPVVTYNYAPLMTDDSPQGLAVLVLGGTSQPVLAKMVNDRFQRLSAENAAMREWPPEADRMHLASGMVFRFGFEKKSKGQVTWAVATVQPAGLLDGPSFKGFFSRAGEYAEWPTWRDGLVGHGFLNQVSEEPTEPEAPRNEEDVGF